MREKPTTYGVSRSDRKPLIDFIVEALEKQGCRFIHKPEATTAPFRFTVETSHGERIGIVAYAFLANNKVTKNRPADEHRFQIKYGGDLSGLHEIWQDPYGLSVTLLLGINPELKFFVAADPVLRNPTRFSVSVEFKEDEARAILDKKWFAWERERRPGKRASDEPLFEALIGGTPDQLLRLIRFEREAWGEEPGERHFLAERFTADTPLVTASPELLIPAPAISAAHLHALAKEFALPEAKVLDLIAGRRMLKMAVRGSVAEEHLVNALRTVNGVENCHRLEDDRGPDVQLSYQGQEIRVECKNVSRELTKQRYEKIDLQRTRRSKDPCSRYYRPSEFDLVAACVHAVTGKWDFKYAPTSALDPHGTCAGRLSNNVKLDGRWTADAAQALSRVVT